MKFKIEETERTKDQKEKRRKGPFAYFFMATTILLLIKNLTSNMINK